MNRRILLLKFIFLLFSVGSFSQGSLLELEKMLFRGGDFCTKTQNSDFQTFHQVDSLVMRSIVNGSLNELENIITKFESECEKCGFYNLLASGNLITKEVGQEKILEILYGGYQFKRFHIDHKNLKSAYKNLRKLILKDSKLRFQEYIKIAKYDEPNFQWIQKYFQYFSRELDYFIAEDFKLFNGNIYSQDQKRKLLRSFTFQFHNTSFIDNIPLTNSEVINSIDLFEEIDLTEEFIIWILRINNLESQTKVLSFINEGKHINLIRKYFYSCQILSTDCINNIQKNIIQLLIHSKN